MQRGFTLLELLVVIALTALLAAGLGTTAMKMLGSAHESDAKHDLRAIHLASMQYLADHNNVFFSQFDREADSGAWQNLWVDQLANYLPPEGKVSSESGRNDAFYSTAIKPESRWIADYAPNDNIVFDYNKNPKYSSPPISYARIQRPAREVMFVEGANNVLPEKTPDRSGAFTFWAKEVVKGNFTYPNTIGRRHGGSNNPAFYAVFCDGHIAKISFVEFRNNRELRQAMFSATSSGDSIYR